MEIFCFLIPNGKSYSIPIALELEGDDEFEFGVNEHFVSSDRYISDSGDSVIGGNMERATVDA